MREVCLLFRSQDLTSEGSHLRIDGAPIFVPDYLPKNLPRQVPPRYFIADPHPPPGKQRDNMSRRAGATRLAGGAIEQNLGKQNNRFGTRLFARAPQNWQDKQAIFLHHKAVV